MAEEEAIPSNLRAANRTDPGWKYCHPLKEGDTNSIVCNFCTKVTNGGITRAKAHLMAKKGNVAPCTKCPKEVREELWGYVNDKKKEDSIDIANIRKLDDLESLGYYESEEEDLANCTQPSNATGRKNAPNKGPMDLFCRKPEAAIGRRKKENLRQTSIREKCDKETTARVHQYIARFWYQAGLSFNLIKLKSFEDMVTAIGAYGPHLPVPSYHDIRVPLLSKEMEYTKDLMKDHKEQWSKHGCSIMSDAWTDRKHRSIINFLVNSSAGTMFVKSIDGSDFVKTGEKLFQLLDSLVEDIGEENVVQVIIDNGSNYVLAGKMLEDKRPHLYWTPCAAHCIDLILEEIGKLPLIKKTIKRAISLVGFIYSHSSTLSLLRYFTNKRELVRHGVTRFATSYLSLERLHKEKANLRRMFTSNEWNSNKLSRDAKGKAAAKVVLMPSFWNHVVFTLKVMAPLVRVLRLVDGERKPAMGYIYEAMEKAKETMMKSFNNNEDKYKDVFKIIDEKWSCQLHKPLHGAGHLLNPEFFYDNPAMEFDFEVNNGLYECIKKLVPSSEVQKQILAELPLYKSGSGLFGCDFAKSQRKTLALVEGETKVLIVATIAWGLRKCSRAIMLALIFLIAIKPGFIHAVYMIFFLIYLLSHNISRKLRQTLVLLCEIHFALLYILQINLISSALEKKGSVSMEIVMQLGLLEEDSAWDFLEVALLACFCTIHNHGFEMLFSFSAIIQHAPSPPFGFGILKAGLNKSVLLSVYASSSVRNGDESFSYERRIASYLSAIGQRFLSIYRSCGTYIAFLTILFTVYMVRPNYTSFGYIFLLLLWIIGRQLVERTKRQLWLPLKVYAISVFIFIYSLSSFSSLERCLSKMIDIYFYLGYDSKASSFDNVWESLAVLIVMQLYSYERRQSKQNRLDYLDQLEPGALGFIRRLLIWHSQKILFIALFYASLSPISAFGFLYLLGFVFCSILPKTSSIPSKSFLVYTGFLVTAEYLFQMWGEQAKMFPGQKYSDISRFLGFRVFRPGFWGLESGLRGKVLVIVACTLQYNVFRWLERMPNTVLSEGQWEEPCPLFVSTEDAFDDVTTCNEENKPSCNSHPSASLQEGASSKSPKIITSGFSRAHDTPSSKSGGSDSNSRKYSFGFIWGSNKESHKWNKKRIVALRKERFETQKTVLKIFLKFWMENIFNLFGLEINMIALLLASFALLNALSMLYIALLAACILLNRQIIRRVWPIFVFLFASILILEYFVIWKDMLPLNSHVPSEIHCHDCWKTSSLHFRYCEKCWFGLVIDDPRMLISYFVVFMLACFKLRADRLSNFSGSSTYRQIMSQRRNTFVWRDLSFETKSMWTFLDYLRLYCYCHLLDLVLILILITGTLEYDILHLGYLAFALVFFRMRLEILKKKNKIFKFLRIYNFVVIILSLAYQSPFVGGPSTGKCETANYIYEMIGFYKYDYGFRITARSAIVEIIIFVLVSLQSYMFSSQEFDYVCRYLEAEQIGAIVREQEKKAAWKTAQLQQIRESEEKKRQRNMQVEKMKSEMLNLQIQLHSMNASTNCIDGFSHSSEGLRRRRSVSLTSNNDIGIPDKEDQGMGRLDHTIREDSVFPIEPHESSACTNVETPLTEEYMKHSVDSPLCEITEIDIDTSSSDSGKKEKVKGQAKENPLKSAVQLIGDGVSQVQSIGNQAVNNLVSFLNISPEDSDSIEHTNSEDRIYDEMESQKTPHIYLDRSSSVQSDKSSDAASLQLGRIFRYIWYQMRSNNDVVCYCCFVLVFLWNFSLLSMVYLGALYLYALCVHTGPSYIFWVVMLIYTEVYILLQYLYQIIIQHCGLSIDPGLLRELGFPTHKVTSSFVVSSLPLFLVYLFTLIQSSITPKDGEWVSSTDFKFKRNDLHAKENPTSYNWQERAWDLLNQMTNMVKLIVRSTFRYWKSLTQGAESPPYFVQVSMDVNFWPDDGIQPERIESGINKLLRVVHDDKCQEKNPNLCSFASRVNIQSIERSRENSNVALVVFEVVYASPVTDCSSAEWSKSLTPAADVAKEILKAQRAGYVEEVGFPYRILSVIGGGKREIDLYAYTFCADLIVFFLFAIFYQSVIKNKSEFLEVYQLEDQFPKEYVFILMAIFFLIVLDRVIYLCSFATGKVIFYIFNLILFTYSVTEYDWQLDPSRQHAARLALRAIFLAKAVSLALQAVQIRYGIPHKSTLYRQFLTSEVSRINYLGYRLYRALPFLYELRCVLDWSCTTTSLTMYDWLKLEDINASLYLVKCDSVLNRATHKQGDKQTKMTKCCNGICLFFVLICVIWAPMLMYSSGNPTNIANPIKDASFQVDIKTVSGRLNLYQTTLCERIRWDSLNSDANPDPYGYLDAYNKNDIQLICCQADASTLWLVPLVVRARLIQSLEWYTDMEIFFTWILSRDRPKGKEVVKYEKAVDPQYLPTQSDVKKVLNGSMNSFRIYNVYPRYFRVTGSGDVRPLEEDCAVSADLVINREQFEWWAFKDINPPNVSGICGGLTGPMAIIISEETPPQGILGDTLSKFSIWGLYITFVLAVGRFIRLQCSDLRMRIPYENLPSCDRLIAICEDIYAARAEGELGVEEVLYWTLVKIYRSPHMLLEYTKPD